MNLPSFVLKHHLGAATVYLINFHQYPRKMSSSFFPQPFLGIMISMMFCSIIIPVSSQCLEDQRILLLQMKDSFTFNSLLSTNLIHWNGSTDCCRWRGVSCDNNGHVIGLDLNNESISDGIDHTGGLFSLQFLQILNLGLNNFNDMKIPAGIGSLTSLTYLNLSNCGFSGQIPIELSHLSRLVVLDLSTLYLVQVASLKLENPNLSMLVKNLTELTELYLDGVIISARGSEWCWALASSLPHLQVLSLSGCYLSGPIHSSLQKLQSLSVVDLSRNNLRAPVPDIIANFANFTVLRLSSCNLNGMFPQKIFQISTLRIVELAKNELLQGTFPEFHQNGSLETLVVSDTNFSNTLPNSIGNLANLSRVELANCKFRGPIPFSLGNLTQLVHLDLSLNMFTGPIPSFQMAQNLTLIDFFHNDLNGSIPSSHFEGLVNLVNVDLRSNSFRGRIPSSLFALPSLQKLQLSNNKFDGQIPKLYNAFTSLLNTLDLSSNNLEGSIPMSVFDLQKLNILLLSSNNFTGLLNLEMFHRFPHLTTLDLSFNSFSVETSSGSSSLSSFPWITSLSLASCKLRNFPDLRNQSTLVYLDLSDNIIDGEIPNWIWNVSSGTYTTLNHLNLSSNLLTGLEEPYVVPRLNILDLHSNQLHGKIPILPKFPSYVDFSSNNFSSSIRSDIGNNLSCAYFFSLSNNILTGAIPESICEASYLQVLDLSNNGLSGPIPSCLIGRSSETLGVLNLRNNNLSGNISGKLTSNCGLKTLDLNGNNLEGQLPKSLANCRHLEVLNLGNNNITDRYPCFLKTSASLHVLVLRSNRFQGSIHCHGGNSLLNLQIIDLAFNNFSGDLPPNYFLELRAMMFDQYNSQSELNHLRFEFLRLNHFYYQDRVTVTNKGLQMELVKILTVFTSIDFSSNGFQGEIPDTVGALKSLYVLNLSHNVLTGPIPLSIGNLTQLGSLDLSRNKINGNIPLSLARLTFLSFLNLSYNRLVGMIPTGSQFQTFTDTSFFGNEGLCGFPLNSNCSVTQVEGLSPTTPGIGDSYPKTGIFVSAALGFVVGLGIIIGPLLFCKGWRQRYYEYVDRVVVKNVVRQQERKRRQRRAYRNPIRRL